LRQKPEKFHDRWSHTYSARRHLSRRITVESKEANVLISPAIFDPNHPKAEGKTERGLHNIIAMRHLWMDFEEGDLTPEGMAELFPLIRSVVFNAYNHTSENPRFRVVIPFDYPISPENYAVLYNNVLAKIVDAGYGVGKSKGGLRSGLDVPRRPQRACFTFPVRQKIRPTAFSRITMNGKSSIQ
jgi:hypothetical protein